MQRFLLLGLLLLLGSLSTASAQTFAAADFRPAEPPSAPTTHHDDDWSVYVDDENHVYYIDFEKFAVNFREVVVYNDRREIVLRDEVSDLPVDAIYEIDFSALPHGKYTIELRSFAGTMRKDVKIM